MLFCDHAGRHIPSEYRDLGLPSRALDRHIAWDIGAGDLTRELARLLDAPALLATYSRLFIDANRPPGTPFSIVRESDGVEIPGNATIMPEEAERRARLAFWPYHREASALLSARESEKGVHAVIMVHTFTPAMKGIARPWHVGILYDRDRRMADPLLVALCAEPDLVIGDNQPYAGSSPLGYGLDAYGQGPGRPHVMVEVRQDLVETAAGAARWAERLAPVLAGVLADRQLYALAPTRA